MSDTLNGKIERLVNSERHTPDNPDVYAIPGQNHIIDTINPQTDLTSVYGKTEAEVHAQEPLAVRMTWEQWRTAAVARQQTPITWTQVTEGKYQEMLEVLPPAYWSGGAFLVGEPWDHCFATGAPRFAAYIERAGRFYTASRPMTVKELRAFLTGGAK